MSASDLILAALVVPAILCGLTGKLRRGTLPPLADCLRWGRRQWGKTLWNTFKMEVSILLAALLLLIPGIIVAIDLIFTETIVALEADRTIDVRERTRALARGHRWRIFWTMLPLSILGLLGSMGVLQPMKGVADSRVLQALADSLMTVVGQLSTVAVLLIYLGLTGPSCLPATPAASPARSRR